MPIQRTEERLVFYEIHDESGQGTGGTISFTIRNPDTGLTMFEGEDMDETVLVYLRECLDICIKGLRARREYVNALPRD